MCFFLGYSHRSWGEVVDTMSGLELELTRDAFQCVEKCPTFYLFIHMLCRSALGSFPRCIGVVFHLDHRSGGWGRVNLLSVPGVTQR